MTQHSPLCINNLIQTSFNGRYHGTDVAVMTQHPPVLPGQAAPDYATAFAKVCVSGMGVRVYVRACAFCTCMHECALCIHTKARKRKLQMATFVLCALTVSKPWPSRLLLSCLCCWNTICLRALFLPAQGRLPLNKETTQAVKTTPHITLG